MFQARLLQMLVGIGHFVVGFVLLTERYRSIMYWYITNNDRCQRQKLIVWNRCRTKVMHLVGGELRVYQSEKKNVHIRTFILLNE